MLDSSVELIAQLHVGSFAKLDNFLYRRIEEAYPEYGKRTDEQKEELDEKEKHLAELLAAVRDYVFPELKGKECHQVRDDSTPEDARIAWDLHQVIREHRYSRLAVLRSSRTCNLPRIHEETLHWNDLLVGIRGELEALATDSLLDYPECPLKDVKQAAKEAAEVITSCLTPEE